MFFFVYRAGPPYRIAYSSDHCAAEASDQPVSRVALPRSRVFRSLFNPTPPSGIIDFVGKAGTTVTFLMQGAAK
jgi:hypothetical protein